MVGLYGDLSFFAGLRGGLTVRYFHFDLQQQCHDPLQLIPLDRHDPSSSQVTDEGSRVFRLIEKLEVGFPRRIRTDNSSIRS